MVARIEVMVSLTMVFMRLSEVESGDDDIDGLDANERNDDSADAIDEQVALQDFGRAERTEFHPLKRQRNKEDDDNRVEDDRAGEWRWWATQDA